MIEQKSIETYVNEYVESHKLFDRIYGEVFAYLEEKKNA